MIEMTWVMVAAIVAVVLVTCLVFNGFVLKIINTTNFLKFQYYLNPLKVNDDNDIKIDLLTGKVQAGILDCNIEGAFIIFRELPEDDKASPKVVAKIWIGIRYIAYGILTNYGQDLELTIPYKPSFASMKKIMELEKIIKGEKFNAELSPDKVVQLD